MDPYLTEMATLKRLVRKTARENLELIKEVRRLKSKLKKAKKVGMGE